MTDLVNTFVHQYREEYPDNPLIVSVNGKWQPSLSDMDLPSVIMTSLYQAHQKHNDKLAHYAEQKPKHDGFFLFVPDDCQFKKTIIHLSLLVPHSDLTKQENLIFLGKNSQLDFIEEQFDLEPHDYTNHIFSTMVINENASFIHCKRQHYAKKATRLSDIVVWQMKNSKTNFTHISDGGHATQENLKINLQEEGATCEAAGFYYLQNDASQIAHHINMIHSASRTMSNMLYKGILKNKSQAIFDGRVRVPEDVKKVCAYQANHHLLLSKQAEVYSKPILEIDSDDVQCKHGATVGQLDEAALFYLCSRGIAKHDALTLLLNGFAEEIIKRIPSLSIQAKIKNELSK
jgi:Fe-S cluster assembly protein SufD